MQIRLEHHLPFSLNNENMQKLPLDKLAPETMMELAEISSPSEDIRWGQKEAMTWKQPGITSSEPKT